MIVTALIVGVVTAYYFGPRPGTYAAGGTFAVLLGAEIGVVPSLIAYVVVGAALTFVLVIGPRKQRTAAQHVKGYVDVGRKVVSRWLNRNKPR